MDSKNLPAGPDDDLPAHYLCVALLGERNRVILQLSDSAGGPARLYTHSQVDSEETVQMLATLLFALADVLRNQPDYFTRVQLPTETGSIFRYIGG